MKKIILSADDFGKSHERNRAIDHAFKNGLISSAALIMGSEYTYEAIEMAYNGGYIKNVHLHLNLLSDDDNHFKPLSKAFINSKFCVNGGFNKYFQKAEYAEYSRVAFKEIEKQYLEFKRLTKGKADYNHIDCHVYCNLWLPAAFSYRKLIKKYDIISARYYGEHHKLSKSVKQKIKFRLVSILNGKSGWVVRSCNVDYYLTMLNSFLPNETVELYVHPDYINCVLMDNTTSVFGHDKVSLEKHIEEIKSTGNIQFISWTDFNKK